jgi:WD40 repeat protein
LTICVGELERKIFCQKIIDALRKSSRAGKYVDWTLDVIRVQLKKMAIPPLVAYSELENASPFLKSLLQRTDDSTGKESALKFMRAFTFSKINTPGALTWIAVSRSGSYVASAHHESVENQVYLWRVSDGCELGHIKEIGYTVNAVAISPDGHLLASCGDSGVIKLWSIPSSPSDSAPHTSSSLNLHREHRCGSNLGHRLSSISFSDDSSQVVAGSEDKNIYIWNLSNNRVQALSDGHIAAVESVNFSPDGKKVVSASGDIHVHDLQQRERYARLHDRYPVEVTTADFSGPDGQQIASGTKDGNIIIWEVQNDSNGSTQWKLAARIAAHTGPIKRVSFSRNGHWLVSGSRDGYVRIWNVATGKLDAEFEGHVGSPVMCAEFSWDGEHILSASEDGVIATWYSERYSKTVGLSV